jgi:probable rRNA maturation factor
MKASIDLFSEGNIRLPYKGITSRIIHSYLKKICDSLNLKNTVITIIVCDNIYIHKINKNFRKKNKPTDVISFSYRENPFPDTKQKMEQLGDIYISLEKALENSIAYEASPADELKRLLIHGVLHLIGYDHEKSWKDAKIMTAKEAEIANAIS